jgi:hypothetical protein
MPPLPPVPGVLKYTQNWQISNNLKAASIFHFSYSGGPPSGATCAALAAIFQAAFITTLKTQFPATTSFGQGTVLDLASSSGAQGSGGTVTAGTRVGTEFPANVAMVINHSIARRYRGGKPRSYLPLGVATDNLTAGLFTSGFTAGITTDFGNWITDCLAASSGGVTIPAHVNVSYYLNGALRPSPIVDTITASTARQRIGSQRRRLKTA